MLSIESIIWIASSILSWITYNSRKHLGIKENVKAYKINIF